jgi:hypothetical protein
VNCAASESHQHDPASGRQWRGLGHDIELRGARYRLRVTSFAAGWLASVDTGEGPTLGWDRSPYLAVSRAVEPIGGSLVDGMRIVAQIPLATTGAPAFRRRLARPLTAHAGPTRRIEPPLAKTRLSRSDRDSGA